MKEPVIADKKPAVLDLQPGTYWWCACGRSKKQPYCDGSHAGTGIEPLKFELTQLKRVGLCLCKRTAKPPFCDGAHKKL